MYLKEKYLKYLNPLKSFNHLNVLHFQNGDPFAKSQFILIGAAV